MDARDLVKMDHDRVPDSRTAARRAERDVAQLSARRPRAFGWSKRHATGDPAPDRSDRHGVRSARGWRRPRSVADAVRDRRRRQRHRARGTQDIGTGQRTLVAMVAADALACSRHRSPRRSATESASAALREHDGREHDPRNPYRRPQGAQALRKVAPALGGRRRLVAAGGRIQVTDTPSKSLSWATRAADRSQPITAVATGRGHVAQTTLRAVRGAKVDIQTASSRSPRPRHPECGSC